jgi:hypothetical protein
VGIWLFSVLQAAGAGIVGFSYTCAILMLPAIAISWSLGRSFARREAGTS